jgi:hypothetical protein
MNRRNFLKGFLATAAVVTLAPLAPIVELPVQNATFEALVATTLKNYREVLAANITSQTCVWIKLKELGWVGGGQDIVEPIVYLNNLNG